MAKKLVAETKFNYGVGKPWNPEDPNSSVGLYSYGTQIFHGSLTQAINFRDSCNRDDRDPERGPYRIYQLTEIPNSAYITAPEMPVAKPVKKKPVKQYTDEERNAAHQRLVDAGVFTEDGNLSPNLYSKEEIAAYKRKKKEYLELANKLLDDNK
jgi:hypothetical protein